MQEQESENKVNVRVDLIGEEARKFVALRQKRGLRYNSELFRQLVKEAEDAELKEPKA